jgi:hypothetical protein
MPVYRNNPVIFLIIIQVDYLLGSNPIKMSYMVGYGRNFPRKIHHRGSTCPSIDKRRRQIKCRENFKTSQKISGFIVFVQNYHFYCFCQNIHFLDKIALLYKKKKKKKILFFFFLFLFLLFLLLLPEKKNNFFFLFFFFFFFFFFPDLHLLLLLPGCV